MAALGLHAVRGLSLVEAKHVDSVAAAPGSSAQAQWLRVLPLVRRLSGCGAWA